MSGLSLRTQKFFDNDFKRNTATIVFAESQRDNLITHINGAQGGINIVTEVVTKMLSTSFSVFT